MKPSFRSFALAAALAGISVASAPAAAQTISDQQIQKFLEAHPELIASALQKAQQQDQQRQREQLAAQVKPVADQLVKGDKQVASIGSGKPLVEFFDYNCGFCKRFHTETATALMKEGKTKFILVYTPILGPGSQRLAEFAAAAHLQGKFEAAHMFLIEHTAHDTGEADKLIPELITAAKLDKAKFDKALTDGSAKAEVTYNSNLALRAGVSGTPMIYVNGNAVPGAIPLEPLKQMMN